MYGNKGKRNFDHQIIYAFAHVESWIESYARSISQPTTELCARVGTLLLTQGEGAGDTMPTMRGDSTGTRVPMGKMEVVEHPSSRVHGRKQTRVKVKGKGKGQGWNKGHKWSAKQKKEASVRMKAAYARKKANANAADIGSIGIAELSA